MGGARPRPILSKFDGTGQAAAHSLNNGRAESGRCSGSAYYSYMFGCNITHNVPACICTSLLIANDALYARPMDLLLIVELEAEAWRRVYHLLAVKASMSTGTPAYFSFSGSRGYQQSSSPRAMALISAYREMLASTRFALDGTVQRQASQGVQGVAATHFVSGRYIYPTSVHTEFSGSANPPVERFEYHDSRHHAHLRPSVDTSNIFLSWLE